MYFIPLRTILVTIRYWNRRQTQGPQSFILGIPNFNITLPFKFTFNTIKNQHLFSCTLFETPFKCPTISIAIFKICHKFIQHSIDNLFQLKYLSRIRRRNF